MADVLAVTGLAFGAWIAISAVYQLYWYVESKPIRIKTNTNFFAMLVNAHKYITGINWKGKFTPKSAIDKEIADEEKEIAELERQKEKMDRLAELKRRKEMLFNEVHDSEVSKEYRNCKYCWGENSLKTAVTRDGISYQICTICSSEK